MSRRGAIRVSVQPTFAPFAPAVVTPWAERPLLSLGLEGPAFDEATDTAVLDDAGTWSVGRSEETSRSSRSLRDAFVAWLNAEL